MTPVPGHRDNGGGQAMSQGQKKMQKQRLRQRVRLRLTARETGDADHSYKPAGQMYTGQQQPTYATRSWDRLPRCHRQPRTRKSFG